MYVEGKGEREGGGNVKSENTTNIIVMVLNNNYTSSNDIFSFGIAEHNPSIMDNTTRKPDHVTDKGILNDTPENNSKLRIYARCCAYVCTYFTYRDNLLSLYKLAYFCDIINAAGVMVDKLKGKSEVNY